MISCVCLDLPLIIVHSRTHNTLNQGAVLLYECIKFRSQREHADYNDYRKSIIKMRTLLLTQVGRHAVLLRKDLSFPSVKITI